MYLQYSDGERSSDLSDFHVIFWPWHHGCTFLFKASVLVNIASKVDRILGVGIHEVTQEKFALYRNSNYL